MENKFEEEPNIVAFMAEVIQGEAGVKLPKDPQYFKKVRALCDKFNVLLILDEI